MSLHRQTELVGDIAAASQELGRAMQWDRRRDIKADVVTGWDPVRAASRIGPTIASDGAARVASVASGAKPARRLKAAGGNGRDAVASKQDIRRMSGAFGVSEHRSTAGNDLVDLHAEFLVVWLNLPGAQYGHPYVLGCESVEQTGDTIRWQAPT